MHTALAEALTREGAQVPPTVCRSIHSLLGYTYVLVGTVLQPTVAQYGLGSILQPLLIAHVNQWPQRYGMDRVRGRTQHCEAL